MEGLVRVEEVVHQGGELQPTHIFHVDFGLQLSRQRIPQDARQTAPSRALNSNVNLLCLTVTHRLAQVQHPSSALAALTALRRSL